MILYIMSRGRAGKVTTLGSIPRNWLTRTSLVVPTAEMYEYEKHYRGVGAIIGVPETVTNYSQKFQYILDGLDGMDVNDKAVILDDDLVFSTRSDPNRPDALITVRDPDVLDPMFQKIEGLLEAYPLVSVHPRQMGQNAPRPYALNGRVICVQGFNRKHTRGIKVDQFPILADVVLNCTLLARGLPNALITEFFQDHGPCQAPGGCSIYRTPEMQRAAVQYLVRRFPGFVKEVERRPKVAKWMGDTRYDYTCQWKKLFAAGRAHLLDPRTAPNPDKEAAGTPETVE
jgi:hypothetical protein